MLSVIAFGEALIDMRSTTVDDGQPAFVQQPGGAPANVAVGVARLGGDAWFVGQVGHDMFGDAIQLAMQSAGVRTDHLLRTGAGMTPLAFVSLDPTGERHFAFYRDRTADLLYPGAQFPVDRLSDQTIFHACSNTLTETGIRQTTLDLLSQARAAGCVTSFDVNYRENLWAAGDDPHSSIREAMLAADIIKLSYEEWHEFCNQPESDIPALLAGGARLVVITNGAEAVRAYWAGGNLSITPVQAEVRDTTAAGDAFVAGLLHCLATRLASGVDLEQLLNAQQLRPMLQFASACGAFTVGRYGAFDALPTVEDITPLAI